jgi:oligopeptide/dipeptide ABC transporter ATP-binding protein
MAIILVSHDMSVISETCDRVAVMYAGSIVELGDAASLLSAPKHPYTHGLLRSIPHLDAPSGRLATIGGQPPDLSKLEPGCPFAPRCAVASPECRTRPIALTPLGDGGATACHFPERVADLDRQVAAS